MAATGNVQQVAQANSQPGNVSDPVPGQEPDLFDKLRELGDVPDVQIDTPDQLDANAAETDVAGDIDTQQVLPIDQAAEAAPQEPGMFDINIPANTTFEGIKQQVLEAWPRLQLSTAVTDDERIFNAEKIFPNKEVTMKGGELFLDGTKLDKDGIELIGDVMDHGRDIVEGIVETVLNIVGTAGAAMAGFSAMAPTGVVAGAPAAIPTGGLSSVAGGISTGLMGAIGTAAVSQPAIGAVSSGIALQAGDVMQRALGVDRDPGRGPFDELAIAGALGAGFGWLGSKATRAKIARNKHNQAVSETMESASEKIDSANEAVQRVADAGFVKDADTVKFKPGQALRGTSDQPVIPELSALEKELSTHAGWKNFVNKQGQAIGDAYDTMAAAISGMAGDRVGPSAKKIVTTLFDTTRAEEKGIRRWRDQALKVAGDKPQQVPKFADAFAEVIERFGKPASDLTIADIDDLALTDEQARRFIRRLVSLEEKILKNPEGLPLKTINKEYVEFRGAIDKLYKTGRDHGLAHEFVKLKNALRDDWADAIGDNLGGESKQAYLDHMGKSHKLLSSMGELGNLLKKENISREAFARQVFGGGMDVLPRLTNIRNIMQGQDPELYKQFVGDYFQQLKTKHRVKDSVDWVAAKKEFDKLGPEFKEEMFKNTNIKIEAVDAMFRVGEIFTGAKQQFLENPVNQGPVKKIVATAIDFIANTLGTRTTIATRIKSLGGSENTLAKYLAAGGLEDAMALLPPNIARKKKSMLEDAVTMALGDPLKSADDIMQERALRGALRAAPGAALRTGTRGQTLDRPQSEAQQ